MLEFKGKELRQFKKWITALDSGKYIQGCGHLQNDYGYCCLGVAVKALVPKKYHVLINSGSLFGSYPYAQPNSPQWLQEINEDFNKRAGTTLSMLNDDGGFTFPEIATLLELVYIHKILDDELL